MLKPYKDPYGFKKLLAYQKAEELQKKCNELTQLFPKTKTMYDLADQMNRSARSGKQNIVEGWRRNTTKEYYDFLGFSIGAIAELEEDCGDIWKEIYGDLIGIKGIMGKRGIMGMGNYEKGNPLIPLGPFYPFDIEILKFYPLDTTLPPIVQLKLRCKELNFMLHKIQESLLAKMEQEKTLPTKDKLRFNLNKNNEQKNFEQKMLEQYGFEKLENGQIVKREIKN